MPAEPPPEPQNARVFSFPTDIRSLWRVLWEKAWIILICAILSGAAGYLYASRLPKIYKATTTVQVELEQQRLVTTENRRSEHPMDDEVLKTIEQNLLSPALALRLVNHPELRSDPAFLPGVSRPATDQRLRSALSREISAEVRRGTRLIDVTVEDESPPMAQKLARVLVEEFIRGSMEDQVAVSRGAHAYLREEAARLEAQLAKSEQALQRYREQHRAVSLEEKEAVVARLKELSAKVTAARAERLKLETDHAQIQTMSDQSPERLLALPLVAGAGEVSELRRKISEKETEIAALSRRYKKEHPKFSQAASELAELKSALERAIRKAAEMMNVSVEAAKITENKLEQELGSQEEMALELGKVAIPYASLEREVVSNRALYESLLARLKEAGVGQGITQHAVHVVAPPLLPDRPSKPNKTAILFLSLCAGLAVGLTLALGTSLLDNSLKTVDQAEEVLGLRVLGAIPARARATLDDARRLLHEEPHSAMAEAFRILRTAIDFTAQKDGYRSVLFTSAVPGEGKSFCAINYSISLAQHGYRTLLIDADLRLPSIGRVFLGEEQPAGLGELLLGQCGFDEAVSLTSVENLSLLPAGAPVSHPAELVGRSSFADVLERALTRFDRVVIDSAPVHAVSEALVLASHADAVCMVVRARKTPGHVARRALKQLRESRAHVPGFILNGLPQRGAGYYYHYHSPGYGQDEVYGASRAAGSRGRK